MHALEQVVDYALDLKNFHETSHRCLIAPILIASSATNCQLVLEAIPHKDGLLLPIKTNGHASLADRSTRQLLKRLAHLDVLLVDELGYLNLKPEQSNAFFKLMEERYRRHSTIITTNLVYDEWPNFLGSRPMVEALLSRLRHYCHTLHLKGPSLREPQG